MLRFYSGFILFLVIIQQAAFAQDSTYRGKEFWAGYGHHQFMETGGNNSQELVFYLSTLQDPATVTITIDNPTSPWIRTYNIPANSTIISDLIPKSGVNDARLISLPCSFVPFGTPCGGEGIFSNKGIHIESNVPIAVYSHLYGSASSGASLLLPVNSWGYTFQSLNSKQNYATNCFSWIYAISQHDNTLIEVTPSSTTRAGTPAGVPFTVTLNRGQIYQVLAGPEGTALKNEMTGTKVKSIVNANGESYPITVFSGSSRTLNPAGCGSGGGDNDMVQLYPLHMWGKRYLTAPTSNSTTPSVFMTNSYKIAVYDSTTIVKRNGIQIPVASLFNNTYYYESNTADLIESDKPILVSQFMTGGDCLGSSGSLGDPDMYFLSPIDAGVKRVNCVRSLKENITINYATIIIPTAGVNSLLIDGSSAFTYSYLHPALAGYTVVIKSWPSAISQFTIQSDSAFTGISYGLGTVESYGYNVGANFKPNNGADPMVPLIWTGGISTNWFNKGNWSTDNVPTSIDHIIIPPGTLFQPIIPNGLVADCKSITVKNGATINIGANSHLNVTGK